MLEGSGFCSFFRFFDFSRTCCVGKTCLCLWECVVRFYPGAEGLLVAVVGWIAILVAETSIMVGLFLTLCNIVYLDAK